MHAYRFILTLTYIAKFSDISHSQPDLSYAFVILFRCPQHQEFTLIIIKTCTVAPFISSQSFSVDSYCEVKFKQVVYKFTIMKVLAAVSQATAL